MSSAEKQPGTMDPTAPAAAPASPGTGHRPNLLDGTPYRFIAPLGRGAMGDVVEAEHVALNKRVVIKLLQERHAGRADYVDRMRIEAQALAKITHPNLVQVTDFGQTAEGRTFLVMEKLQGKTVLEELETRTFLPVREAIDIVRQALAGLAVAHEAGIVHRDIKLDNLFLCETKTGERLVKVLDFGLAKVVSVMGDNTPLPLAFPTAEGVAMGTPRFFSPEQARGRQVDQRTDIYAAGMVLYHLLAGKGPFNKYTSLLELTRAHAFERPVAPSALTSQHIPPALDLAVLKALEKEPIDRFQTAAEFAAELEKITIGIAMDEEEPATMRVDVLSASAVAKSASAKSTPAESSKPPTIVVATKSTKTEDPTSQPKQASPSALPKTHDDDVAPDTPTQRLERPMPFMRSGSFASQVAARQAAANALQATLPSGQMVAKSQSAPPPTEAAISKPANSEPATLPRREPNATEAKSASQEKAAEPHHARPITRDITGIPQRESAIPRLLGANSALREHAAPRLFGQSGDRISSLPKAPPAEPIAPPAPLPDTTLPFSAEPESDANRDPLRDPIRAAEPHAPPQPAHAARTDRISVLPGRSERTSNVPPRAPERTSNIPPRIPEAGFPERKSGIPTPQGKSTPPPPLAETDAKGPVRPLRAPVPWRKRPASAPGVTGNRDHAQNAQQPLSSPPNETDAQTKLLFFFAAFALAAASLLLALRFLR